MSIEILPLPVAGEIETGADLAALVLDAGPPLLDGDVVVLTHKAVSKAEGRIVDLSDVVPSPLALEFAEDGGDPRQIEVVLRESKRVVRRRGSLLICETHHGFICASAGVDRSNTPGDDLVVLLPEDPDASAARIREALRARTGRTVGVIVADTMGRPLRNGILGTAIGVSGVEALRSLQGDIDPNGYELRTTQVAIADELAAAADLVFGKLERVPAALIRGYAGRGDGTACELIRSADRDLFI